MRDVRVLTFECWRRPVDKVITQTVTVADARAWAGWIRGVRADIAERMEEGHINPELAAPEPVHEALLQLLEAIDRLPADEEAAELQLVDDAHVQALLDHLGRLQRWFDQLVDWGMVRHRRSEPALRFQRHLSMRHTG